VSNTKKFFWNSVFVSILVVLGLLFYAGAKKIDYNWHWDRVPSYIVYKADIETKAKFDGTIYVEKGQVKLEPDTDEEAVIIKNAGELQFEDGDTVLEGDVIFIDTGYKVGPLLKGLLMTLYISAISIVFAIIIGLFTGLARISSNPAIKKLAVFYIEIIRGTPLLVQIFIFYFFIGTMLELSRMSAGIMALSFFAGAYIAEIVRAGIQSIPKGQMEAARSLGMSYTKAMTYVILPQAFKRTLPPMAGQFISLIKDSSLVSVISITDLTKAGREIVASTFSPFEVWMSVAIMYLLLTSLLSLLVQRLEIKMAESD